MALISNGTSIVSGGGLASGIGGKVIQVQYNAITASYSYSGTWHNTNITDTITPTSSSNKIKIDVYLGRVSIRTNNTLAFRFYRNSTSNLIGVGGVDGSRPQISGALVRSSDDHNHTQGMLHFSWIDNPNTTSSTTYMMQAQKENNGTWTLNRNESNTNSGNEYNGRGASFISLTELAI